MRSAAEIVPDCVSVFVLHQVHSWIVVSMLLQQFGFESFTLLFELTQLIVNVWNVEAHEPLIFLCDASHFDFNFFKIVA